MPRRDPLKLAQSALRDFAKTYPFATEDHPWGETAMKVKGKVFVFLSLHDGNLNVTVKLPLSCETALGLPFAEPTGYGLGKHGWVTSKFGPGDKVPVDLLREWIDESYRAVAPRTLLGKMEQDESPTRRTVTKAKKPARRIR
jgi:predicted DNA-binding protein (MmcQ/YjbR family)